MKLSYRRRDFLAAAPASLGIAAGCSGTEPEISGNSVPFSHRNWWEPGPNKDLTRDLTPGTTPIRLACMTPQTMLNYPTDISINEAVKRVREHGYTSANIHYGIGTRNKWLDASEAEIRELKEACVTYDVEIFDTMVWTNLIHPDHATCQKNLKYVAENVEAADRIGCRMVTAVTGSRDPDHYIGMHPDNWTRETWNATVASIRQILNDTSGCATALGMETIVTTNLDSPIAHRRLMDDIADERCKTCFDLANATSFERYYHSTETVNEAFDLLGEDIIGCHGKDNFILRDEMLVHITQVPPGQGIHDYEMYLVRMSRMQWPRTLLLEHFSEAEYPAIKRFIEETARRVGVYIYS